MMIADQRQLIWIKEGCIQCFWCQNLSPEVFVCGDQGTQIRSEVRVDQRLSANLSERSPLTAQALTALDLQFIQFVADGCPVKVITMDPRADEI